MNRLRYHFSGDIERKHSRSSGRDTNRNLSSMENEGSTLHRVLTRHVNKDTTLCHSHFAHRRHFPFVPPRLLFRHRTFRSEGSGSRKMTFVFTYMYIYIYSIVESINNLGLFLKRRNSCLNVHTCFIRNVKANTSYNVELHVS